MSPPSGAGGSLWRFPGGGPPSSRSRRKPPRPRGPRRTASGTPPRTSSRTGRNRTPAAPPPVPRRGYSFPGERRPEVGLRHVVRLHDRRHGAVDILFGYGIADFFEFLVDQHRLDQL